MVKDTLLKTAELARLNITATQQKTTKELESILDYIEVINSVQEGVDSNLNLSGNINVFKQDKVESSLNIKDVLRNAPKVKDNYIEIEGIF